MENHSYSSYPDSHDSSPRSREIECENASLAWDEPQQAAAARVKLMCSYGGRIQPRPHDNQLSYVGGETKILAVDRSIRFPAFLARLTALLPGGAAATAEDVCFKYQLPGEDLDALISVTNDEDLEHMMLEYDRLLRPAAKPATRLRIFLFPLAGAPAAPEQKPERQWFVDALNSIPALQPEPNPLPPHAPPSAGPDYLFGLDKGFAPPPAVMVKDPAPEPTVQETLTVEMPVRTDLEEKDDRQIGGEPVVSPAEIQRQIQELQRMQIAAENHQQQQQQQAAGFQRNGSDETLAARAVTGDYYPPRSSEKVPPPATAQIPAAYWPEQRAVPTAGRYASMAGGDQSFYFIPAAHGMYPGPAAIHPGAYYAAMPRMVPTEAYRDTTAVFSMAPPPPPHQHQQTAAQVTTGGPYQEAMRVSQQQQTAAQVTTGGQYQEAMRMSQQQQTAAQVAGGQYQEAMRVSQQQQQGGAEGAAFSTAQVAYDSAGRAVYYTGAAVPTYQAVTSVGPINPVESSKVVKTPQVS